MESNRTLRVTHVISGDLWAGAEAQAFTMMTTMQQRGNVDVSAIVLNHGTLAHRLTSAGIRVALIDESRHSFWQIVQLARRTVREYPVDILHSHRYKENLLVALVKLGRTVRCLVQTVHGVQERLPGWKSFKVHGYGLLNRFVSRRYFDLVMPVSEDIRRQLARSFPESQLVTVHNSVAFEGIKPLKPPASVRHELGIKPDTLVVGAVGRLVPIKGFDIFLRVAQLCVEKNPLMRFVLVGDGPERAALENQCKSLGLESAVLMTGFRDDIIDVVNTFDIFLMTSWHEGVPVALLEAMALGKPVIATAVGGVVEVIEPGRSGTSVVAGDTMQLAEACLELASDEAERKRLGTGAQERIAAAFSADVQCRKLEAIYRRLAS